jgi:hypothetical protein
MGHLVKPPISGIDIDECLRQIKQAILTIAELAKASSMTIQSVEVNSRWGILAKRKRVQGFDRIRNMGLIDSTSDQNFSEVVNQCATMGRLVDALTWCKQHKQFTDLQVKTCHPTTSSATGKGCSDPDVQGHNVDNDLVLVAKDDKVIARFEVSDVASSKDTNKKLLRDLISLSVLNAKSEVILEPGSPRRFLVISKEFSDYVLKSRKVKWGTQIQFKPHKCKPDEDESTFIVEVTLTCSD